MKSVHPNGRVDNQHISSVVTALIYTRVSSDEQAREGLSLDAQLADDRRYVSQFGWAIGGEYQDILTGNRDDRPAYQAMLAEARRLSAEGRRVVIVVKWLHRLGRRVLERVRCREELKGIGVTLHSVAEGGEVSDLVANILASVAEEEVRQLSERVRSVNQHITASGWTVGGHPAWGYQLRDASTEERATGAPRRVLEINPDIAPYVRDGFRRVADGESVYSVARWFQGLPAQIRHGNRFTYTAVMKTLRSPTYIAQTPGRTPGRWPALIDETIWQRVQDQIASHKHMPHQASGRYLATGLLRCPRCGGRMRGHVTTDVRGPYRAYRCRSSYDLGVDAVDPMCNYGAQLDVIDSLIMAEICAVVSAANGASTSMRVAVQRAWQSLQKSGDGDDDDDAQRIRSLERERDRAKQRLTDAAIKLVDGDIDKEGYNLLRDRVHRDLDATDAELQRLQTVSSKVSLPDLDEVLREVGGWANAIHNTDVLSQRAVLATLIDRIVPVRLGVGKYRLDITWKPLGEALRQIVATTGIPVSA